MTKAELFFQESENHIFRALDQVVAVRALLTKGLDRADAETQAAYRFADDACDELEALAKVFKAPMAA